MLKLSFQHSRDQQYPVYIGENLLSSNILFSDIPATDIVCVVDEQLLCSIPDKFQKILSISALDCNKSFAQLSLIIDFLLESNCHRSSYLLAIGGGVVSDLCGMAAALFKRGLNFVNVPTTMLAQVDAAYGGKNGINYAGVKNLIGTIYSPRFVACDVNFLNTLPLREYRQGIAEVIKHAVGFDDKLFSWLVSNHSSLLNRDLPAVQYAISRSVEIKSLLVCQDTNDLQVRRKLNFGHTFAHALEAATSYKSLLHGEAVSIGIAIASFISMQKNLISTEVYWQIINLIKLYDLPYNLSNLQVTVEEILSYIKQDKKNIDENFCLVLPYTLGRVELLYGIEYFELKELLSSYVSSTNGKY